MEGRRPVNRVKRNVLGTQSRQDSPDPTARSSRRPSRESSSSSTTAAGSKPTDPKPSFTRQASKLLQNVSEKLGKDAQKLKRETQEVLNSAKNTFDDLRNLSAKRLTDKSKESQKPTKK